MKKSTNDPKTVTKVTSKPANGDDPHDSDTASTSAISAPQTNVITFNYPNPKISEAPVNHYVNHNTKVSSKEGGKQQNEQLGNDHRLDFIGSSTAVKDLFGLPYSSDVDVAVAVHNIGGGTLLIDGAVIRDSDSANKNGNHPRSRRRRRPYTDPIHVRSSTGSQFSQLSEDVLEADDLMALVSNMLKTQEKYLDSEFKQTKPLLVPHPSSETLTVAPGDEPSVFSPVPTEELSESKRKESHQNLEHILPKPEVYTNDVSSPTDDPRFYQQWKFHDYNMLVGSDAIVVKCGEGGNATNSATGVSSHNDVLHEPSVKSPKAKNATDNGTTTTLTVRIADAEMLRSKLSQREDHIRSSQRSYAEALGRNDLKSSQSNDEKHDGSDQIVSKSENAILAYPDFGRVSMQSCVLPTSDFRWKLREHGLSTTKPVDMSSSDGSPSSSPVCMVLDAYLDNIIANVPQLALCLQEKGLIQAVKIFGTQELPTISATDLLCDGAGPKTSTQPTKPLFSPALVESNAAMMLEFLKTNCSRENSTYLLKRNAGETSVQLLDVTSLSRQRHRKWIYWLAMISLRFALRLDRLAEEVDNEALGREYRHKKRGLLENALELLHELADMGGGKHETISSSIYEQLADSYLSKGDSVDKEKRHGFDSFACSFLQSGNLDMSSYSGVGRDGLSKAQDLLMKGTKELQPVLRHAFENQPAKRDGESNRDISLEVEAVVLQMYGLYHKLINVTLSLADFHLVRYRSSSVMQALRLTGRVTADAASLLIQIGILEASEEFLLGHDSDDFVRSLAYQYAWLIENCGNFARSFAADEAWRERGHASGEDVIGLLLDVELLSVHTNQVVKMPNVNVSQADNTHSIVTRTKRAVNLNSLSGVLSLSPDGRMVEGKPAVEKANAFLKRQKQLQGDKRRVLVAAAISYGQAADIFVANVVEASNANSSMRSLMLQRLGDACNEIGKVLLVEVRTVISKESCSDIVSPLLLSAEFWFKEGLKNFELCNDARNIAFLRCNMSHCCKIRANTSSSRMTFAGRQDNMDKNLDTHAELCLNDAARHLELAHEALDQRDAIDPSAWDMVSMELAATYLVLGVGRRQTLIGSGSSPVLMQALRLNPGAERSIIIPIQRSKEIYDSLNVHQQAAAANYQLALYYSKVWTCQRDEVQTKDKLSKAFDHFGSAHKYFFSHLRSNEDKLVCLILDLSGLYSTTSTSYECQQKALLCCLDTCGAFSQAAVEEARGRGPAAKDWFDKMGTLNDRMEARLLELLSSLVKIEKKNTIMASSRYEEMYRSALRMKFSSPDERITENGQFRVYNLLSVVKSGHTQAK